MTTRRVLLVGATGTVGKRTLAALVARGHHVIALTRAPAPDQEGVTMRVADVTEEAAVRAALAGETIDAVISCLATRTGAVTDAWLVEHRANLAVLEAARAAGAHQFVLLSAICVQKPRLEFQRAKLAFEEALVASGITYSIVRPTAFFKSLSGQIERVKSGKPFLLFGDGELTSCKPMSEADVAAFLVDCLDDPAKQNSILPVGGPGPAITPRAQAALLFAATGMPPKMRHVPVRLLDVIIGVLSLLGRVAPKLRDKAELARIGRFYATESMLVLDEHGVYSESLTPSYGSETLGSFYAHAAVHGLEDRALGDHAVFSSARRPRA